jgi:tight adherence protein C
MENTPLILSLATFVVILLLYGVLVSFLSARGKARDLLRRTEKWSDKSKASDIPLAKEGLDSQKKGKSFSLFGKKNSDINASIYADTPLFYQRAGIYNRRSIRFYQTLRFILLLAPLILLGVSHFIYHRPLNERVFIVALFFCYIGYSLPVFWLRLVARSRKKDLNRTFPDAMDLLMVCVEAGMGIDSAIRRVSKEIYITSPELAKEFKILSLELKTGRSRNSCLKSLALRADLPDVNNLVSLLIQADKYGTGVANALKVHAEEMRQKRYSRLEELAAKLPVKLTVPLILFIFPAFFVVIAGPAAIRVLRVIIQG